MINYNVTGPKRKELVNAIGEILGIKPKYLGMPSTAFQIGDFIVSKSGELSWNDEADGNALVIILKEKGYMSDKRMEVSVPAEYFTESSFNNLNGIIEGKKDLFKMAFDIDQLELVEEDDVVKFPWFKDESNMETYELFIKKLCELSRKQKRVQMKQKEITNPKYEFRCFLLRLGFIGDEYKKDRKILLSNLEGSASFKQSSKGDK